MHSRVGRSSATLEARLAGVTIKLRAVALSYALLCALSFALAAILVQFTLPAWSGPFLWRELESSTALSIAIYLTVAAGFGVLAWLSLRFLALGPGWRSFTAVASILPALWGIIDAVKVTLVGHRALAWMPAPSVIGMAWIIALAYAWCSYSLWKYRRASNQRLERP